jgi:hypothetical protein
MPRSNRPAAGPSAEFRCRSGLATVVGPLQSLGGTCAAYRTRVWALGPGAGGGDSDLLDDDVGVVEGGSVGGDVVWVAGEDLGGAVERGCYDD